MNYLNEYKNKLVSAEEAVKLVKSGDVVIYEQVLLSPNYLDSFLAKRKDELKNVRVHTALFAGLPQVAFGDPTQEHFCCDSLYFALPDRMLQERELCYFVPNMLHDIATLMERMDPDVFMVKTTPMDKHGYFNCGLCNAGTAVTLQNIRKNSGKVILEVNENVPYCHGCMGEAIHISDVTAIVESDNKPLLEIPSIPPTDVDKAVATHIMKLIEDESVIQLGIGSMPNTVGSMIAQSDLKNLGCHTEMMIDAYIDMFEAGVMNGRAKAFDKEKMVYTIAGGTKRLYDFLDHNPLCVSYPVEYVVSPITIAKHDKFIAICNAMEVDLFGQVSSESSGFRQISATGGQLSCIYGAIHSKGGKGIICMSATKETKDGQLKSRIVPTFTTGTVVTVPRSVTNYVVTEYGSVNLKAKSTWERAELLISIAHPDMRDELVKEAEKMNIWRKTNKLA